MRIKRILKWLLFPFQQFFLKLWIRYKGRPGALNRARKKAVKLHKRNKKRYRVFFLQNRYQVLTRDDLQKRKHTGEFDWIVNSTNMNAFAFFDTNTLTLKA